MSVHQAPTDFAPLEGKPSSDEAASSKPNAHQLASLRADEAFERAEQLAGRGDEAAAIDAYLRCAAASEGAHEWYLVAISCRRVGDFLIDPRPPHDLQRALRMYRRAAVAFENCGLHAEARELYYRVNIHRLRRGNEIELTFVHRIELFLYWLTAGFGFRPLRVVGTSAVVILIYAVVYWLLGGAVNPQSLEVAGLLDSLYFSGITFSTVGYGDFVPAAHARLVALTEGFLGAFLMGFFVVVLAHRLSRA